VGTPSMLNWLMVIACDVWANEWEMSVAPIKWTSYAELVQLL
jgi:hypothetical protein